eukprot:CAMPEP_0184664394 /NCGR_PEP_ID=MMETSP0308-20130426/52644_1 /TAXON_ID=38269 /ORGANISM="Gloeochaete witrockiana, Strain SAG 46.84" /LENGTH=792 /DNA_ID=CAMNT_0027107773 /DNA_START=125 /DNA_END=2503 /DNA_ORIENTATION=-
MAGQKSGPSPAGNGTSHAMSIPLRFNQHVINEAMSGRTSFNPAVSSTPSMMSPSNVHHQTLGYSSAYAGHPFQYNVQVSGTPSETSPSPVSVSSTTNAPSSGQNPQSSAPSNVPTLSTSQTGQFSMSAAVSQQGQHYANSQEIFSQSFTPQYQPQSSQPGMTFSNQSTHATMIPQQRTFAYPAYPSADSSDNAGFASGIYYHPQMAIGMGPVGYHPMNMNTMYGSSPTAAAAAAAASSIAHTMNLGGPVGVGMNMGMTRVASSSSGNAQMVRTASSTGIASSDSRTSVVQSPLSSVAATPPLSPSVEGTKAGTRPKTEGERKSKAPSVAWRECPKCMSRVSTVGFNWPAHMQKCDPQFFEAALRAFEQTKGQIREPTTLQQIAPAQEKHSSNGGSPGSHSESPTGLSATTKRIQLVGFLYDGSTSEEHDRKQFLEDLQALLWQRGTPLTRIPSVGHQQLDLYLLYRHVINRGGIDEVVKSKLWKEIVGEFQLPASCTSASFSLRVHYQRFLEAFERAKYKPNEFAGKPKEGQAPHASAAVGEKRTVEVRSDGSDMEGDAEVEQEAKRQRREESKNLEEENLALVAELMELRKRIEQMETHSKQMEDHNKMLQDELQKRYILDGRADKTMTLSIAQVHDNNAELLPAPIVVKTERQDTFSLGEGDFSVHLTLSSASESPSVSESEVQSVFASTTLGNEDFNDSAFSPSMSLPMSLSSHRSPNLQGLSGSCSFPLSPDFAASLCLDIPMPPHFNFPSPASFHNIPMSHPTQMSIGLPANHADSSIDFHEWHLGG